MLAHRTMLEPMSYVLGPPGLTARIGRDPADLVPRSNSLYATGGAQASRLNSSYTIVMFGPLGLCNKRLSRQLRTAVDYSYGRQLTSYGPAARMRNKPIGFCGLRPKLVMWLIASLSDQSLQDFVTENLVKTL